MSLSEARARLWVAAAACLAFAVSLFSQGWPRDDRWLILEHPLLRVGWPATRELLTSGYVQPLLGARTPIHEWRPVLSLSFLIQRVTTGFAPFPFHAVNLLLHILAALLVHEVLRRRLDARAAITGALFFAVTPVHAEVVAYISSRSELLGMLSVLGAWLILDKSQRLTPRRTAFGAAVYLAGALSKEHVLLFPLFLMMSDWTFRGEFPWERERRRVHSALIATTALVLAGRALVLPSLAHGGVPYFSSVSGLSKLLTLSKFWAWHYLRPAVTALGLCSDYARPLIADSNPTDLPAWISLLLLGALVVLAVRAFLSRRSWGFWFLGPCLFLLPTSHLIISLDTLGAQRFLYLPSLGLAAAVGALFLRAEERAPGAARAALAALLLWLGLHAALRAADWRSDLAYDRAATSCNPVSVKARTALGTAFLREGRLEDGERELIAATRLDAAFYDAAFNLARLSYGRGDLRVARERLAAARALKADEPSGLLLQALLDEAAGNIAAAEKSLELCLKLSPNDATARYNYARVLARLDRPFEAAVQLKQFLRLAPDDPNAPAARLWLMGLERSAASPAAAAGRN
ncbi:MAG: hypothetical protein AAB262_04685 [Elusimicrobiota bacterium]